MHKHNATAGFLMKYNWNYLPKDKKENRNHVWNLFQGLSDYTILVLSRDFPFHMKTDSYIREFVNKHMKLTDTPGIYIYLLLTENEPPNVFHIQSSHAY